MTDTLSAAEARRIALAAQGFTGSRKIPRRRPFDRALEKLHVLQIDSVNVFARSHYLPVFSRHGAYDQRALDEYLWDSGEFTEYWAHEAAFIPVGDRPLFGWRMRDFEGRYAERIIELRPELDRVRGLLAEDGPQPIRELDSNPRGRRGPWWDWSDTKRAVEILFATGEVVTVGRERFERRYALAADVLPAGALGTVPRADAHRSLVERAACCLGVGTLADLADYHRLKKAEALIAVHALEEEAVLVPVQVEGWSDAAWMHRDAVLPSRVTADALLTPFDPIVWFRPRAERIFNFHYRIEIYTPKEKRRYGYYCLPLMVGGRLVGRLDLKADRARRELIVQAAWEEPGAPGRTAEVAARLLHNAAAWQGLESVSLRGAGNLEIPGSALTDRPGQAPA
ncbi:winged helix-turn-helix domain-containing protein [Corynebacterium pacaense]|uniref:winged helix-turn-helix domain-containing protein n=1 Tax=Corynebacterium pacaense TaxID=1816684 RepID=UPI0009B94A89|nr:crosslink repair DNA glycosylase YcaQ family protein [Corynebacterium pacaense]